MPLDGSGHFTPIEPQFPAVPNTTILSQDYNDIWNDAAAAMSMAMYRDGQAEIIADIPFWEHKITRLAKGTVDTDATNFDQVFHNPHFQSTVAGDPDGVVIEGNRFTGRTNQFYVSSADVRFTGATNRFDGTLFDLNAATVDIDGNIFTLNTTANIALVASTTLTASATTSATVTAPTINLTGTTTAALSATSSAVTPVTTDDSTKIATTAYVKQVVATGTFPIGTGNNHKLVTQDAGVVGWTGLIDATVNGFADGADPTKKMHFSLTGIGAGQDRILTVPNSNFTMVGEAVTQTLSNKTLVQQDNLFQLFANGVPTKKAHFDLSTITTGQDRVMQVADENMLLFTPGTKWLATVTASNSAQVDLEGMFDNTYDCYHIVAENITVQTTGAFQLRFKIGGTYVASSYLNMFSPGIGGTSTPNIFDSFSSAANVVGSFAMRLYNPEATDKYHSVFFTGSAYQGGTTNGAQYGGTNVAVGNATLGALTGIRFIMASGNILTGTFRVYGMRKSS